MNKNIFDIKNRKNDQEKKIYEKKIHTPDNVKTLLIGYAEVPVLSWGEIPKISHIRYIKKDGTFVRGGFVINNDNGVLQLANNLNTRAPGYTTWFASHSSLDKIYKKGASENRSEEPKIEIKDRQSDIIRQVNKLTDAVKQQKVTS